jgi:transcriptional regulator with XRE-family HTH domain
MYAEQIIKALTEKRKQLGLTQKDVAERMECHSNFVQVFEYHRRDVRFSSIERYAAAIGVELRFELVLKE